MDDSSASSRGEFVQIPFIGGDSTSLNQFVTSTAPPTTTTSPPTTNANYTTEQYTTMLSLNILELVGHLALDCPFSALNFWLILHTAILHPNLKFILLCQSSCIFVRAVARIVLILMRFTGDFISTSGPTPLAIIYTVPVFGRNFLAHVLIIERTMATVFVRTYEHMKKPYFSITWFPIVLVLASLQTLVRDALFSLLLMSTTAVVALLEIFTFSCIWKYNDAIYYRMFFKMHSLSERYQLSENIRTAKQLIPTLCLYFINISVDMAVIGLGYFHALGPTRFNYELVLQIAYCTGTLVNFAIEVSMLINHPFLKRDFLRFWRCLLPRSFDNKTEPDSMESRRRSGALALWNMRGEKLVLNAQEQAEGHFKHLQGAWDVVETHKVVEGRRKNASI